MVEFRNQWRRDWLTFQITPCGLLSLYFLMRQPGVFSCLEDALRWPYYHLWWGMFKISWSLGVWLPLYTGYPTPTPAIQLSGLVLVWSVYPLLTSLGWCSPTAWKPLSPIELSAKNIWRFLFLIRKDDMYSNILIHNIFSTRPRKSKDFWIYLDYR